MGKNQLVHLSDIHIRFGSRHEEFRTVLNRTVDDIKTIKPRRIVFTGDLFHIKINLSPTAVELAGEFLKKLAEIAPVDVLLGNHDLNMQSLSQGNAVSPIIELLDNGFIITSDNPVLPVPAENKNGIYFYRDSGFYDIEKDLVYGVYSCWDSKLLTLTEKKPKKKYIGLFHGPVYGCVGDNGYEMKSDELTKLSTFNNFDIVMLGDIHEYQAFEKNDVERIAYAGSLLQQNFGESIEKGFLVWDLNTDQHTRRFIPNDYGYSRLNIMKGEIWEDRVQDLKFSLNKKKTKVEIILHDDKENYSVEKLSQIEKYIRDRFGCESVSADFQAIEKENENVSVDSEEIDVNNTESAEKLLVEFLQKNNYENIDDVIELSRELDKKLNVKSNPTHGKRIEYNSMEVSNLLSFPVENTLFNFDRLNGITGIFGPNYNGKSNVMKVFCWILYGKMPGDLENSKSVNMYTGNNKGWGKIYFTIAGTKYFAFRSATVKKKKDGTPDVSYVIEYKKEVRVHNELTGEDELKWVDVESEEAATEKKEKKKLIVDYIGTYEDFMVCAMQSDRQDYLSLSQQPKNDLINKFLGLEVYREKYDLGNETFKTIKAKQRVLGDPAELETQIADYQSKISLGEQSLKELQDEKEDNNKEIDGINIKIVEATKKLHKIEVPKETDVVKLSEKISRIKTEIEKEESVLSTKESWLKENFQKELPDNLKSLDKNNIEKELNSERNAFASEKEVFTKTEEWLKSNSIKEVSEQEPVEKKIADFRVAIASLQDKLKIAKGEKCPTCNHIKHEANPELEQKCLADIERGKKALAVAQAELVAIKGNIEHNAKFEREKSKCESLKMSLQARHSKIQTLKTNFELCSNKEEIVLHNNKISSETNNVNNIKTSLETKRAEVKQIEEQIVTIENNKNLILENSEINESIKLLQEEIKVYKTMNLQVDTKIKEASGNAGAWKNNIENLTDKLNSIRETDRIYKKYSVYLQAVGRDGIPAMIIAKKLPIINHKINNLLKGMVAFKVDMYIKPNGDVKEIFYFSDKKTDTLPLNMGSGSVKFITSTAISDALHYVSLLIKPSLKVIDEGFDTLDNRKLMELNGLFNYLKSKYKNIFIVTHKSEVRDFVDNIIEVQKTKEGITDPDILSNPEAGISRFVYS